jgi:hypothetical protein
MRLVLIEVLDLKQGFEQLMMDPTMIFMEEKPIVIKEY